MTENILTPNTAPQTEPTLRQYMRLPNGVLQKHLKPLIYLGAVSLVIVAALFSSSGKKTPAQNASTKGQPPQPSLQDNTDNNVLISTSWILPSHTRLIGEGRYTTIEPSSSFTSGTYLINMGTSGGGCVGTSVEHLKIDGNLTLVNGVANYCGDASYVSDVNLHNLGNSSTGGSATALTIESSATGSGPYTNINYSTSGVCATGGACPVCVNILAQTRGLHGITCSAGNSNANSPGQAGIYVSASNNTIEDVHTESFWDGVQIGGASGVSNVSVINILSAGPNGPSKNEVHLCGPNGSNLCTNTTPVSDITILNATDGKGSNSIQTEVIQDDVVGTVFGLTAANSSSSVGMYIQGDPYISSGTILAVPRFTTAPGGNSTNGGGIPSWAVGSIALTGGTQSCSGYNAGTLYSNTGGAAGLNNTLFICSNGFWHSFGM